MLSNLPITIFTAHQKNVQVASLRSKRFRLISEQKKTKERDFRFWPREKWNESQKLIFRAAFDSRSSFFAPKPHGNAWRMESQYIRCLQEYKAYFSFSSRVVCPDRRANLKMTFTLL